MRHVASHPESTGKALTVSEEGVRWSKLCFPDSEDWTGRVWEDTYGEEAGRMPCEEESRRTRDLSQAGGSRKIKGRGRIHIWFGNWWGTGGLKRVLGRQQRECVQASFQCMPTPEPMLAEASRHAGWRVWGLPHLWLILLERVDARFLPCGLDKGLELEGRTVVKQIKLIVSWPVEMGGIVGINRREYFWFPIWHMESWEVIAVLLKQEKEAQQTEKQQLLLDPSEN